MSVSTRLQRIPGRQRFDLRDRALQVTQAAFVVRLVRLALRQQVAALRRLGVDDAPP
jgi:hypothetical protein